ncbi:hypothetical protein F511_11767 [Dorcoceras hygrometricum]|uniref:Remorin C-terminal domain-containing protein n=1 Tax=Dorcoceras hygrometricum TaxID=472368 RepID=A0A2Z7CH09_9LAMI|nr:hypothetical protein F511_11767 [Dorcoceras hygrometricum]
MPELGFQDLRSGFMAREMSPNSVIFNAESKFSIFSPASGSAERCSFASDAPDQDSLLSQVMLMDYLRHESSENLSCSDLDPNISTLVIKNSFLLSRNENSEVQKLCRSEAGTTEDENVATVSEKKSFSRAVRECQDRRLRSEILSKKSDRQGPASIDHEYSATISVSSSSPSPRLGVMKKASAAAHRTSTFPSPETPNQHTSIAVQKGWSSERVPQHMNADKWNVNSAFPPYNNGRTLPSKWEDAERWIFSPMSGDGAIRTSVQQPQKRPKSKSGPLGPPGVAYYQMFSPAPSMFEGGNTRKLDANSSFLTGVMAKDALSIRHGDCEGREHFLPVMEPSIARSISIHGCSEILNQSLFLGYQDDKYETQTAEKDVSSGCSRRDMATQMSPESSIHSSSGRRLSFSLATPSTLPIVELKSIHSSKPEIKDMPVDGHVTMTRWSKNNRNKGSEKGRGYVDDLKRKALDIVSASRDSTQPSKSNSTIRREEDRIAAWENLQKAKAEAAIRKLEMKLEKKRSSSMDKIMNKLRSAQKRAQDMRSSMLTTETHQIERLPTKALSVRRTRQFGSFSGCFTCHAF